jgi:hypothetical protein
MSRKIARMASLSLLLLGSLFIGVAPVAAYDHTNYAGRADTCPRTDRYCGGSFESSCHWTIYGKVNNEDVLFGPAHCFNDDTVRWGPGQPVYNGSGVRLGVIAVAPSIVLAADMTWMWLDTGQKPFDKNEIPYRGGSWSISQKIPNSSLTCTNLLQGLPQNHTMRVSYWTSIDGYEGPYSGNDIATGSEDHGSGNCLIRNSVNWELGAKWIPSGAPWLDITIGGSGFLGTTTQCYIACTAGADMMFNSWRQAIIDLNAYSTSGGAWFCANDACT